MPVRFAPDDIRSIERAAKGSGLTVSQWVRAAIRTVISDSIAMPPQLEGQSE